MPAVLVGAAADELSLCAAAAPTRARSAKTAFILVRVGFVAIREEGRVCLTEEGARQKARQVPGRALYRRGGGRGTGAREVGRRRGAHGARRSRRVTRGSRV